MRVVVWFSCGSASAVAAKLALDKYGDRVAVVYCDMSRDEHPDNQRFRADVERWLGVSVDVVSNPAYTSVDEVFERTRYMSGIQGARCTVEMKKVPRFAFQRADDIHVFGFTADEGRRIQRFRENNPELLHDMVLHDQGVTKERCHGIIAAAGIEQPMMYRLSYTNNNCLGCVKATSARYWNMIRRDFPEVFDRRVRQSREIGVQLTRVEGERVFLDELPADYLPADDEPISCGPDCQLDVFDALLARLGP